MYALFPMRSTCYVLCRLNSNGRMYFALKLHEVSPCPCLEGQVLVLDGGSVLVNITGFYIVHNSTDSNVLLLSLLNFPFHE